MEKQVINYLKNQDIYFVVAGNGKTHIKNSNSTIDVVSNNHQESHTHMCYCLGLDDLENEVVCFISNDTNVFNVMLGNYERLNSLTLLISWSNEKWIHLTKVYEQLGTKKAKALFAFTASATATLLRRLPESPKTHGQNRFLNSILDVFEAFESLRRHVNTKIMHNLEVLTAKVCSKKSLKGNDLAELRWRRRRKILKMASRKIESRRNQYLKKYLHLMKHSNSM